MEKNLIVCPVDFTEVSNHALDYASIFAEKMKGDLIILHVINKRTMEEADSGITPYSTPGAYDKLINSKLETLRNDLERKSGINVRTRIEYGDVDDIVPQIAREKETSLIVMGTSGAKGMKEIFEGTNTLKVLERTYCPILIIPEDSEYSLPKYWVYATDLKAKNQTVANKIWQLCSLFDGKLDLLHVEKEYGTKHIELKETQTLKDDSGEGRITFNKIKHSNILKGIDEYVGEKEPDVLALTYHEQKKWDWLFKEDKIGKVVENANFPILVLHDSI